MPSLWQHWVTVEEAKLLLARLRAIRTLAADEHRLAAASENSTVGAMRAG